MLTATYSIVAITTEQDKTRSLLARVRQYLQSAWRGLQKFDRLFLDAAFGKLARFDKTLQARKLEVYLVPALRRAGTDAQALIAELERLSDSGRVLLRSIGAQLAGPFEMTAVRTDELFQAMERYCEQMSVRLEREERELIPMARRLFSIEDWFAIAAQFLADEGGAGTRAPARQHAMATPARRTAATAR